ncbi:hypothetical protein DPMN_187367, partial [Dreissena polymorpha]
RASRDHLLVEKCIHSQLSAAMTKEDPDIQMLLAHAKDFRLSYELSSRPAAFFEAKNILCTADTPQIAKAI